MYIYKDAFSKELTDKLYKISNDFFYGIDYVNNIKNVANIYTNMVWQDDFKEDSNLVLFIALSKDIVKEVEDSLIKLNIFNFNKYKSLTEHGQVMLQIWSQGSYAKEHIDQTYGAAATLYLNNWTYEDGGRLEYLDQESQEWNYIVPQYNLLAFNDTKIPHKVSRVNTNRELRTTLQVFMYNKED
jgi:hypothetical protein